MSVLTLSEAKSHLNISSATYDGELQAMIDAAEAVIVERVGPLGPVEITSRVTGTRSLVLPVYPVLSLTSVADSSEIAVDLDTLDVDLITGVVTSSGTLGCLPYSVTYMAGRASLPANLRLAVLELVRHFWDTQRGPSRRPGSTASDSASNTVPGAAYLLPFRVEQLLAPYARFTFA